jgi:site-specific recombinase XerD
MKTPISSLHDTFCQECQLVRNLTPATIRWYRCSINGFMKYKQGEVVSIEQITSERLREYLYSKRIDGSWSPDSFLNQYKGIKSFLKWCVNRGYFESNPIDGIEKPKLPKRLPKRIPKNDAFKVLEYAFNMKTTYRFERYRNRAILASMIFAGLRAKESLDLRLGDVDMTNRVINISLGKGNKDRVIPISPALHKYFEEYLKDRERLGKWEVQHFFASLRGDVGFSYRGLTRVVARIRKKTGINFSPHKLRHTFATLMLEGGCDLFSLQKMMGHSDIKTTTIYLSATVGMLQKQILKHPMG